MARVRDLWKSEIPDPTDPTGNRTIPKKTARHPDLGGNRDANRWQAVWIGPDGREKTKTFAKQKDASNYARKMEEDLARGEYIDPKAGKALFREYGQRWLGSRAGVDPSSVIQYESKYRIHVEPKFGGRRIGSVRPSEIQEFLTGLSEKYAASTVKTVLLVLQGVFDLAVADEKMKKNPAKSDVVKVADPPQEKIIAWPDETVFAIIDAHPEHLRPLPVLGAGCGMRIGEWLGLAAEDIDFDEQVIHVRRQLKKLGRVFVFALPKSDKERTVPMPQWVAQYLKAHIKAHKPRPYTLPWEKPTGRPRTVNLLFRWHTDDKHVRERNYEETVWKPILAALGLITVEEWEHEYQRKTRRGEVKTYTKRRRRYVTARNTGTHQLRHHYASATLTDGVSIKELAEYLGHSDPGFTLRVYAHMQTSSFERARAAIDKRMMRPRLVAGQN